ncbi:nucleotide-sugar transporter [Hirsutella rhossiliensis]|uniref:Nucleotide-sugar transporter domain-containing protein n=1 Tax=Hirsutella rhossiliensis TaxID=111463 RepID=A0A9P8MP44_9HYPO|nr:nucleotide-sugar transporter domain-containing protein [Hirsutella rhossiliensis]KAH0958554.1 nucleotide-sugar transporter domain-containing protein [Hirsutella rhossiliensis]
MTILETVAPRRAKAVALRNNGFARNLSLITLTFQNSALILIMHYSRIMPPSGDHRYFTSTAVLLNEVIKLAVALTLAIYETSKTLAPSTPATVLFEQIYNAVFSGDGWKLILPAAFYTLQNLLQYVAVENLDPVHFQVLYQVKILTTAIFSVVLLRRHLGIKRWVSLCVLTFGVSVVSLPSSETRVDALLLHGIPDHYFPRSKHELGQAVDLSTPDTHLTRRSATYEGIANDLPPPDPLMNYSVGATAAVVAAVVSGLAGVYFEKLLKESPSQTSVWIRNIQLSFYSIIAATLGGVIWQDGSGIREHGFFEGYNWVVWAAIGLQAAGGLIASIVIRDADNIVKNFATSISIVISFIVSVWVFEFTVTVTFLLGTSLVLLATYLYSIPERSRHRPPAVRIVSFEKPAIERVVTPGTTPRIPDASRLNSDPFDAKGLAMTSSRPNSPMLPRQASRTHMLREE